MLRSAILFVQLLLGAWVAGLNAGYVASDWPLMQGRFFPDGIDWSHGAASRSPTIRSCIHFLHRWWAWVVVAALVVFARTVRRPIDRRASIAIHSAFGTQILLGIATVMSGVAIWPRRAPPGGRRTGRRCDRLGRACLGQAPR